MFIVAEQGIRTTAFSILFIRGVATKRYINQIDNKRKTGAQFLPSN